eukprot:349980_1
MNVETTQSKTNTPLIDKSSNTASSTLQYQREITKWKYATGIIFILLLAMSFLAGAFIFEANANASNSCSSISHIKLNQQMDEIFTKNAMSGCSIHSIQNQRPIYSYSIGYTNITATNILTKNSLMRIASVTKPIVGVAIEILLSSHIEYTWNSTIYDIIKDDLYLLNEFTKYKTLNEYMYNITLIHLISHQSGIRFYNTENEWRWMLLGISNNTNYTNYLKIFGNDSLIFEPGNGYEYTSYGYIILAILIEKISGETFYDFMKTTILNPLQLYNTIDNNLDKDEYEIAMQYQRQCDMISSGYSELSSCYFQLPFESNQPLIVGGFWSNAADIATFGYNSYFTNFLSDEMKTNVFNGQIQVSTNEWYSLGWFQNAPRHPTVMGHTGAVIGGSARVQINVEKQMSTAVLCNTQSTINVVSDVVEAVETYF